MSRTTIARRLADAERNIIVFAGLWALTRGGGRIDYVVRRVREREKMEEQAFLAFDRQGDVTVATVTTSELTSGMTDALLDEMKQILIAGQSAKLVLDLTKVKFIDSVALGALVVLLRRIREAHGRLALVGLSGHFLNVMTVTGLQRVFELHDSVRGATEELQRP
jgi:anti-sigma B factor antagonist